jgi:Zn-dependent M28 family amino/carboxypeptidase
MTTMTMRTLVETLCSPACAGRRTGTAGGRAARAAVVGALREAGLDPFEQQVPLVGGANVVATIRGTSPRWVLVGAHHDHLGEAKGRIYHGADDNAAAVAILVEVARRLHARPPDGRGVLLVSFEAEEPPYFLTGQMGSQYFVGHAPVPIETIDLMVCMDLVGHRVGGPELPTEVGDSLFLLGAERGRGTAERVDAMARAEEGVIVRRVDAESLDPLSDYEPFWRKRVPFAFLTAGRSRVYHTPDDTPEKLDWAKIEATARWLERFVRDACARDPDRRSELQDVRDDASTLESLAAVTGALTAVSPQAQMGHAMATDLLRACRDRELPSPRRAELLALLQLIEQGLG